MKENELQSTLMSSLQAYCQYNNIGYDDLSFYANQQGASANKFAADFCATIDGCSLFMFEVKVLDIKTTRLKSFDKSQYDLNLWFQNHGLPIFYIYNIVSKLSGHLFPKPHDWFEKVLKETKYSKPNALPHDKPYIEKHQFAIEIFKDNHWSNLSPINIGACLNVLKEGVLKTNGLLVVIYGNNRVISSLADQDELEKLHKVIVALSKKPSGLSNKNIEILNEYLEGDNESSLFLKEKGLISPGPDNVPKSRKPK